MYMKFAHNLSVFLYIRRSYDHYIDEKIVLMMAV